MQDAQEFLNFLINHINEIILGEQQGSKKAGDPDPDPQNNPTWINDIFQVRRISCCGKNSVFFLSVCIFICPPLSLFENCFTSMDSLSLIGMVSCS